MLATSVILAVQRQPVMLVDIRKLVILFFNTHYFIIVIINTLANSFRLLHFHILLVIYL